jgi:Ca2+/Na+ antiporter
VKNRLKLLSDASMVSHQRYWRQFIEAFHVRSDADEEDNDGEDDEPPSLHEHCMHLLLFPWKLLAALVPPVDYCGGWLCFFGSLFALGGVTLIVGDLASLLGCCLEIPDSITAITFVALGTSLPDTFASRTAAIQDPTADASVGNVTGSNSVNVFLGLGLPWLMSNAYWDWHKGTAFVVPGGNLVFSVQVFTTCAGVCLGVLLLRRLHPAIGAELGGPTMYKHMTSAFLALLWFAYIALSCWDALKNQSPCD